MAVPIDPLSHTASRRVRVRVTVVGVAVAWTLAALFLVLGWKSRAESAQQRDSAAVVISAG